MTAVATPFARLHQRLNGAVLGRLADAQAQIGAGEPFAVMFEKTYAEAFGQVDSAMLVCTGAATHLGTLERDSQITVSGKAYRVHSAEPDGTGMVRLELYEG